MTTHDHNRWLPLPTLLEPSQPRTKNASVTRRGPVLDGFLAGPENACVALLFEWLTRGFLADPLDPACQHYIPITELPQLLPLSLYGASGTGKTHIMRGLASVLGKKEKASSALFCENAIDFYRNLTEAIANGTKEEFRSRISRSPLILLDNIDYLADKRSGQDELLWLLEESLAVPKIVLVTMSVRPADLEGMNRQIVSRLIAGSVFQVKYPGAESRRILVRRLAELFGIPLSEEVFACLVEEFPEPVGALYGSFVQLTLQTRNEKNFLTVQRVLNFLQDREPGVSLSLDEIAHTVASFYRVQLDDLRSKKRSKTIVLARNITAWFARKFTNATLVQLGDWFSGRDHTTILHSCNEIERRMASDPTLTNDLAQITRLLSPGK
ncbi:MAG: DnaA/Hda family protein [Planctomycetia bacterium]|nr:DnaA/Hda family protein [Planctomycetia bacterium]